MSLQGVVRLYSNDALDGDYMANCYTAEEKLKLVIKQQRSPRRPLLGANAAGSKRITRARSSGTTRH
ncbi:MAG: hypothetical protein U0176_05815 [Bacteroidia bacterium]